MIEVLLPQWGMGMSEGTVISWLRAEGDRVERDEPLVEIEAEKVTNQIVAPCAGTLVGILVAEDDTVPVRTALALIDDGT